MASTMRLLGLSALTLSSLVYSQQIGKKPEVHPKLTTQTCSKKDGCTTHETSVVLDALAHPIKNIHTGKSCLTSDGSLKKKICSTAESCAANCALEGVDYADHGVYTQGDRMTMRMYLREDGKLESVSPRVYLLDENKEEYSMLKLLGQEVSFDTDVSNLPCGMNGALYFLKWKPRVDGASSILLVPLMGRGTVMRSASTLPLSSMVSRMSTRLELAAMRWTSGGRMPWPRSTRLTPATSRVFIRARVLNVGRMESVTSLAVVSILVCTSSTCSWTVLT